MQPVFGDTTTRQEIDEGDGATRIVESVIADKRSKPLIEPPRADIEFEFDLEPGEKDKSSHARFIARYQSKEGFRKRTSPRAYADAISGLIKERGVRHQHTGHAEKTKARIEAKGPTADCYPNPLHPGEAIFNTFRIVSDEPEEVLFAPSYFKLSVADTREREKRGDQLEVGDILEVYDPKRKRLRFAKRAIAVDIDRRVVSWEDTGKLW